MITKNHCGCVDLWNLLFINELYVLKHFKISFNITSVYFIYLFILIRMDILEK